MAGDSGGKKLLLFGFRGFAGQAEARKLRTEMAKRNVTVYAVEQKHYLAPLAFLLASGAPEAPGVREYDGEGLPVRMLVFAGLDSGELDEALAVCRENGIGREDLKAVLTPHNAMWNAVMLAKELQEEHFHLRGGGEHETAGTL